MSLFLPNDFVRNVYGINPQKLVERKIRGIITDLDNTLVEWDRPDATPNLIEWFQAMKEAGIQVTIVSNNNGARVKAFADPLNIPFISRAKKPMGNAFVQALNIMKLQKNEVVVIGDQLLTDVIGGNRIGLHTILVVPVASNDGFFTRFNRFVERRLFSKLKANGHLVWKDEL